MPVSYQILPHRNLVLVTYTGHAGLAETLEQISDCTRQPEFRPWMRHLVDVSQITGYERDFPGFFAMQARAMDDLPPHPDGLVIAFLAPTRIGQEMAQMTRRSWDGLDKIILRVFDTEEAALSFLGIAEPHIEGLRLQPQ
jgi:hypothetical protein